MEPDQLEFERDGVAVVHGAFDASGMVDAVWEGLSRYGFTPDDPDTWDRRFLTSGGFFGQLTRFGKSGVFASIAKERGANTLPPSFGDANRHNPGPWGRRPLTLPTPPLWLGRHRLY